MKFQYALRRGASELDDIKRKAAYKMMQFQGDNTRGTFSGGIHLLGTAIEGKYTISGDTIFMNVWKKPNQFSWEQVDEMLRELIVNG